MNPSDMQLFHIGTTFFMKLPDETFFSVTPTGSTCIIDQLPPTAEIVKKYPDTGIENTPPSSTFALMKVVLMVAQYFAERNTLTSTEEKGA